MGELAWRGYNVALPEIDKGDDIFSVNDVTGAMLRIQVKTSMARRQPKIGASKYSFNVRGSAISEPQSPELHFVFACRVDVGFRFIVMSRDVLRNYVNAQHAGSPGEKAKNGRRFEIQLFDDGRVTCLPGLDWSSHLEDWAAWPSLR